MTDQLKVCRHCHLPIMLFTEQLPEGGLGGVWFHTPPGFPNAALHNRTTHACPNGLTWASPLPEPDEDGVFDAEIVDWPDTDARSPLYRDPKPDETADPDILDAEVVEPDILDVETVEGPELAGRAADVAQAGQAVARQLDRAATARMVPTGSECWWRLYRVTDSPLRAKTQDHGVLSAEPGATPHQVVLDLVDVGRYELSVLAWQVSKTHALPAPGATDGDNRALVDWLDLLVDFPPTLPGQPRQWQQLTQAGQLRHPGNDRENWRYDWFTDYGPPAMRAIDLEQDELTPKPPEAVEQRRSNPFDRWFKLGNTGE